MRYSSRTWFWVTAVLLSGLAVWLLLYKVPEPSGVHPGVSDLSTVDAVSGLENEELGSQLDMELVQDLKSRLLGELELVSVMHGEEEAFQAIRNLLAWIEQAPPAESAVAVTQVLAGGRDAFTFGRFAPGKDGFLDTYPTFRTALLDVLEKLDPARAVTVGKEILDTSENPDEWALSLRALARHGNSVEDRLFLQSKVQDLLHKNTWLEEPTFSFLHAFDAAVQDGQLQTIERLGELASTPPNRAVAHAAILSVDRFFQQFPTVGVSYVIDHPEFLKTETGFRASLMARVNPVEPVEMASAESYLGSNAFSEAEKRTFFEAFPNFNSTFSHNLITGSLILSRAEMRERSLAAFNELSAWLTDQRYPEFEDEINSAVRRLAKTWKLDQ